MDVINELIAKGYAVLEDERLKASAEATEKVMEQIADRTGRIEAVRAALEMDETTFEKFDPEYKAGWSPNVLLTWHGESIGFSVDKYERGYTARTGNRSAGCVEYLAREMARILDEHESLKRNTIGDLSIRIDPWWMTHYQNSKRATVWNEPEIVEARSTYLLRVYNDNRLSDAATMKRWLECAADVASVPAIQELLPIVTQAADAAAKREHLLECIKRRDHPVTGQSLGLDDAWSEDHGQYSDVVTREEVDVYRAAAVTDGLFEDDQVQAAIAVREQQMNDALLKAAIEEKRAALEAELFRPFVYFTVQYGILATEDGVCSAVATESFDTLHDLPDVNLYWLTVRGKLIKPTFVCAVEKVEVNTLADLKLLNWKYVLKRSTEFGDVYVSPQIAEVTR